MLRLTDGYHLFTDPDGRWLYARADGGFVRIDGPAEVIATLSTLIATGAVEMNSLPAQHRQLAEELLRRGVLDRAADEPGGESATVLVEGTNPVSQLLRELLDQPGVDIVTADPLTADHVAADIIVSCADRLTDDRWQQLDRWCGAREIAWHRTYVEGTALVIGPFTAPGRTASYRDTRGRLLAAAQSPDELLALWAHLDRVADARTRIPAAAAAVAAGLLAADVLAYLSDRTVPSHGHQLVYRPGDAVLTRHPVLPLPRLKAGVS
ncbi:hypothetical protein [Nocardia inohanensis]|uniref:hypothetical protein n=1 Tax=Nocardia inohanensis TaxID=209246 RepID=UPI000831C1B0|nr:hypothetical protein [Nocardia inohanensis]